MRRGVGPVGCWRRAWRGGLGLVGLAGALGLGQAVTLGAAGRPAQLAPGSVLYLPHLRREVPCEAACRTATARATRTPRTATPTATPPPTGTPSPTRTASVTPTATAAPSDTLTATASATVPSRTPTRTRTVTPTPSITPLPTARPPDPAGDRLQPLAALAPVGGQVVYLAATRTYRLQIEGSPPLTFELDLTHPDNANGRLTLRHVQSNRFPMAGAGLYYRAKDGALLEPRILRLVGQVTAVEHEALPDGVRLTVRETLEETSHVKRFSVRMVGRALMVHAESLDGPGPARGAYAGFGGGDIEGTADGVSVRIPYMAMVPLTMLDHKWFAATLLDYPVSGASELLPRGPEAEPGGFINDVAAIYAPDAAGNVRAVDETAWVVMSQRVEEVFPALPGGASPHRPALVGRVAVGLDAAPGEATFAGEAGVIERLRGLGLSDLLVIKPSWQDPAALAPAQLPPASGAGGAEGFRRLASSAGLLAAGGAYTLTLPGCPDKLNPAYRPEDRVLGADGQAKRLPDDAPGAPRCSVNGAPIPRNLLAPAGAQAAFQREWPGLKALGVGASYLPELLAWSPAWPWPGADANVLDQAATPSHPASLGAALRAYKTLFAAMQRQGPLVGAGSSGYWEAAYDTLYAGYVDGLWRSLGTGSPDLAPADGALVIPDYELGMVRPRLVAYGMGPYARFFGPEVTGGLSDDQLDTLRAFTLAYGHAGAFWSGGSAGARLTEAEQGKEYFTSRALQGRYLDAPLPSVRYLAPDDTPLDLSTALKRNLDLANPRLVIQYGPDLTMWINHGPSAWPVVVGSELYSLPPDGWLATGAGGFLAYSALVEGRRVDYLWTDAYVLMDGRGRTTFFGSLSARNLKVVFADGRVLEEAADGRLSLSGP